MPNLNLLPLAEQQKRKVDLLNYYTLIAGITLVTGAVVLAGILLLFDQVYRVNLNTLTNQKAQVESQAALYLDVQKKAQTLEKQLTSITKAQAQTTHWATLLTELQAVTPPGVSIKSVQFGQGADSTKTASKTDISGSADSRRSAAQLQLALSTSQYFKNPEIQTTTLAGGVIDYRIAVEVNYDKLNGPAK